MSILPFIILPLALLLTFWLTGCFRRRCAACGGEVSVFVQYKHVVEYPGLVKIKKPEIRKYCERCQR